MLYLGSGQYIKGPETSNPGIFHSEHAYGLFGYLVRPRSIDKLMRAFPLKMQLDSTLNIVGLRSYIIEPNLVQVRRDMGSNIQIDR